MIRSLRASLQFLGVALLFANSPSSAVAQPLLVVSPGARVELTVKDSLRQGPLSAPRQTIRGTLIRATSDSIWIQPVGSSAFGVAQHAITGARSSRGISRWQSAATFGLGLGVTVAAIQAIRKDGRDNILVPTGAAVGVGLALGTISPFEQWRRIKR